LTAIPAFAQQNTTGVEAECAEKFKATDLNGSGAKLVGIGSGVISGL